jgi:acyl-CoA thioesterase FadM
MLQVSATISTCGGASVDFTQTAVLAADGETVASAAVRVVCVKNGRATPLPVTLADKIKLL